MTPPRPVRQAPGMDAPYRHIVCCMDQSAASLGALDAALRLRSLGPGRLTIVHVAAWGILVGGYPGLETDDPARYIDETRQWLDGVVADHPGTDGVLLEGYPPVVACDWAADAGADLMIAASSRGLVDRVLLGSFAGHLLRHAPCTVLLTRPSAGREHGGDTGARGEVAT